MTTSFDDLSVATGLPLVVELSRTNFVRHAAPG
jgi:hypothetical protein